VESLSTLPKVTDRVGRYRILSDLGRGSMAQVYLALDPNIDREVALKVFLPRYEVGPEQLTEMRRRFIQEAKAAGRVRHPGIVMIYDADTDVERDLSYIAMERIEGRSLWEILAEDGPMPELPAVEIVAKVAMALHAAHEEGLVHLDVKPGNILCSLDGSIKVTDFGIAQLSSVAPTQTDWISGSPFYMSPEQLAGAEVDLRSDVYSLGAVLYECLCGAVPFTSESLAGLRYMIEEIDPRPLQTFDSRIRGELACVAMKALSKAPSDRFQSTLDMAKALGSAMKVAPILIHPANRTGLVSAGPPTSVPPPPERHATPPFPASTEPIHTLSSQLGMASDSGREDGDSMSSSPPIPALTVESPGESSAALASVSATETGDVLTIGSLEVGSIESGSGSVLPNPQTAPNGDAARLKPAAILAVPATPGAPRRRRWRWVAGLSLLFTVLAVFAGLVYLRSELPDRVGTNVPAGSDAALPEKAVGPKVRVTATPPYVPTSEPYALDAYNLGDPPVAPIELEADYAAERAAQRRRQAAARQLLEDAVQARAAASEGDPSSGGSVLTSADLQPVEQIAAPVEMATLEIVFRNRLKGGSVTVAVDGETVWTETFSGAKNVLRRKVGKDVWVTVPVEAGERDIAVRVTGSNGKIDLSKSTQAAFGKDEVRRLRLVHIPPRGLKFSWKDGEGG